MTTDSVEEPTPRELEVLRLLAKGYCTQAIANYLCISVHTVRFHVKHLCEKLNATSRADAPLKAVKAGWITLDEVDT